jgi:subtilase family serine protease
MSVMVNETTTNQGSSSVGPTVTKFYLSANASYDATDTLIGSRDVPALAGGAASSVATALVVPTNVAAASYWVIARADADAGVAETNETNNTLGQGIAIGGDLVIGVPTGSLKGAASLSLDFTDTVTNQGGGPSAASTTRYYLSTNTTLSADDVLLGGGRDVAGLTPGGVSTGSTTIWLPASASPGVFYIVAKADGDNLVGETSESNNTASRQIAIGPDLVVSSFSAPASGVVGSSINITETVKNQGAADVASTSARFYLSTNSTLDAADTPLGSGRSVPSLAGGASSSGTTPVTIPATTNPGFYYLLVKADGDSAAAESSEVNNVSVRTMWVTAP